MRIPGRRYYATLTGSKTITVTCESCNGEYYYTAERKRSGSSKSILWLDNEGASARAEIRAEDQLEKALANAVDVVPCPSCGWVQEDMCDHLKRRRLYWGLGMTLGAAFVLWLAGRLATDDGREAIASIVLSYSAAAAIPIGIVATLVSRLRCDPNARHSGPGGRDPEKAATSRGMNRKRVEAAHDDWLVEVRRTLLDCLIHVARVDGPLREDEVESIANVYGKMTSQPVEPAEVRSRSEAHTTKIGDLEERLGAVEGQFNHEARRMFLQACLAIALADDEFVEREYDVVDRFADALDIPQHVLDAMVDEMRG